MSTRSPAHQEAIDALEIRILRLLELERLAWRQRASTSRDDCLAVGEEIKEAMRAWREAVAP